MRKKCIVDDSPSNAEAVDRAASAPEAGDYVVAG